MPINPANPPNLITNPEAAIPVYVAGGSTGIIPFGTPANAGADGIAGQMYWDSGYIYVCVATNTWKRTALSTWT